MGADNWLQESRLDIRFASLLQLGSLAILDFSGLILAANQSFCEMLGYAPGDLVGKKVLEVTYPEDRELGRELIRRAIAGEIKNYSLEKRYLRRDGSSFWAQLSGTILCEPQTGEPQYFASMIQDIDARKKAEFALAEAENRWSFALESAGQGVWDFSVAEGRTFYSKTWKAIIGYEEHELSDAGELWQSFVHPDDLPRVMASDKDHLAGLTPFFECEFRMRHKLGHWVWILDRGKVVARAADGSPLRMIGTHTDISARKAADNAIREAGDRYRLLADNSTDMIMRVRKSGRRVYVSPACRPLLGWAPEEMLDIPTAGALHPDDVASLTEKWLGGFESDEAMVLTYRMRRKDGAYVWVESISRALPVAGDEKPERILVVRDIDRRVAAEQELKDSEARYRLLAEFATDIVFQLDRDLVRRYVSPAAREILGYEPEELVGVKAAGAAHPEDAEALLGVLRSLISGEHDRSSMSCRMRHRDGHWLWVDAQFRLLRDSQRGTPTGVLVSLRDVSKRKEAEDRLERDNRKLASQAARDGLTGLLNRRSFDEALEREFRRSKREATPLGLVMIDVDTFKSFNDLYGHPAGDACLRAVSAAIAGMLQRPGDCAARYGGEEFAILLPNTDEDGAIEVAERIRLAVRALKRPHSGTRTNCVTISAGAESLVPGVTIASADGLVQAADRALYAAKRAGRDQVVGASALYSAPQPHASSR